MRRRSSLTIRCTAFLVPTPSFSLKHLALRFIVLLGIMKPVVRRIERLYFSSPQSVGHSVSISAGYSTNGMNIPAWYAIR